MRRPLLILALAACTPARARVPEPAPVRPAPPTTLPAPTPTVALPARDVVPAFRTGPLVQWGPLPAGTAHAERVRTYDLQHQSTHVRFDWTRHAVVGRTTLRVAALDRALDAIALDAVGMTIGSVRDADGRPLRYDYDRRTLRVHLKSPLAAGRATSITVAYESVRPKKGAYFIDRRHIVWTQGETEDTRYWVPTYDSPNDKTTWEFFIRTSRREKALSNGRLADTRTVGGESEWHWVQDKPASTYLMTAATGDYTVLQDKWRDVPIGYWTYPDSVEPAWRGFGRTPRMVDLFSAKTGVKYPWAKYDQIVAPDYIFGGMENVTATTQDDDGILHPAWAEPQQNADGLVSHELGHQWYGDLLTARDWSHVWLHEGFATFMEQTFREADKGVAEGGLDRLESHDETIAADRRARRPIVFDRWVTDPLELFLSGHIYPKGATVLQMLRHQLGDSLFWRAMNRYAVDHLYGSVVTADLERAFTQTTGRDFAPFFRQWVYGAGFPAFQVSYSYDSTTRRLTMTARQVQPRDSLTGLFDADVDIEILTDAGAVHAIMPVRGELSSLSIPLASAPRSIRWDKGDWLLDVTDFPRPTSMLSYQLAHDDDALGRIEAVDLLAARLDELDAARALADAVRGDAFWSVRSRALRALGAVGGGSALDAVAAGAALDAVRDRDSRVRQEVPAVLARHSRDALRQSIGALLADSSLYVRGAALQAFAAVAPDEAMPAIQAALGRSSWLDIERTHAVAALASIDTPESWTITRRYLAPGTARATRRAAIASLVARSRGREAELTAALVPLLDADDFYVREDAARALGQLGQPASIAPLEARRRVEAESRVINEIDAALAALRRTR